MATVDWTTIYLGTVADTDTNEATLAGEDTSALLATFGSAGAPLSDSVLTLTTTSANTSMERDNAGTLDRLTFETTPGGSTATTTIDAIYELDVLLRFTDGDQGTLSGGLYIIQDDAGHLFLLASDTYGSMFPKLFTAPIESIRVNGVSPNVASLPQSGFDSRQFSSTSAGPTICFLSGTRIRTPTGEVPVEDLRCDDAVDTLDHGPLPIRFVATRTMNFPQADSRFKPYRIKAGSLGGGLPRRDLKVSRQHRLLIDGPDGQVLGPVSGHEGLRGVSRMKGCRHAVFHSLILPHHAIHFAEGAPAESFYPGPVGLRLLPHPTRLGICALFPGIEDDPFAAYGPPVRPLLGRGDTIRLLRQARGAGGRVAA